MELLTPKTTCNVDVISAGRFHKPLSFYGVPMPWKLPVYTCDKKVEGQYTQSPGSFGAERKYDVHTGVDLYTEENEPVFSMEDGVVVKVDVFTGPRLGHHWWNETFAAMVEGESGVICYGEIKLVFNFTASAAI